jgi:hypothetical protein
MTTDQLRDMLATRPFTPFIMHLADGRNVEVNHPEAIAYAGGRIAVVVKPDDRFEVVDLLLVPSIESKTAGTPPAPTPPSRG